MVPIARARNNMHELQCRSYCIRNMRKHFFTVGVTKHCHRWPREAVELPSVEVLESSVDVVLGKWLQDALLELYKMKPVSPFQHQPFFDSEKPQRFLSAYIIL